MSEPEERPREQEPNPTQGRMDEEGTESRPVDVEWDDEDTKPRARDTEWDENEPSPHEGEEGQEIV